MPTQFKYVDGLTYMMTLSRILRGSWASLVVEWPRIHLPMQEMQVCSLGWEDPPDQEMATHYSLLAWKIPWTEEPDRLQSIGS